MLTPTPAQDELAHALFLGARGASTSAAQTAMRAIIAQELANAAGPASSPGDGFDALRLAVASLPFGPMFWTRDVMDAATPADLVARLAELREGLRDVATERNATRDELRRLRADRDGARRYLGDLLLAAAHRAATPQDEED